MSNKFANHRFIIIQCSLIPYFYSTIITSRIEYIRIYMMRKADTVDVLRVRFLNGLDGAVGLQVVQEELGQV